MMVLASAVLAGSLLATGAQARGGGGGGGGHMGGFGGGHMGGFGGGHVGGLGGAHMAHFGGEHFGMGRRHFIGGDYGLDCPYDTSYALPDTCNY
jgi:hypothetical protein